MISKNLKTTLSIQQLEDDIKKEITYKIEDTDIEFNEFMDYTENDFSEEILEENKYDEEYETTSKLSNEFKCDECDYETTAARYLKAHKKHHKEGKYVCIKCSYSNHKPYLLKAHITKVSYSSFKLKLIVMHKKWKCNKSINELKITRDICVLV